MQNRSVSSYFVRECGMIIWFRTQIPACASIALQKTFTGNDNILIVWNPNVSVGNNSQLLATS